MNCDPLFPYRIICGPGLIREINISPILGSWSKLKLFSCKSNSSCKKIRPPTGRPPTAAGPAGPANECGPPAGAGLANGDGVVWLRGCIVVAPSAVPTSSTRGRVPVASPPESGWAGMGQTLWNLMRLGTGDRRRALVRGCETLYAGAGLGASVPSFPLYAK